MKKIRLAVMISALFLPLLVGSVYAVNKTLTKEDEVKLKQDMKPDNAVESTQLVGIFAPGFEIELADAKLEYTKEYGEGNFQVLEYNSYTLLVPPNLSVDALTDSKTQVDNMALGQQSDGVDSKTQTAEITKIREVFGVEGEIVYIPSIQAYADEKGFQYNFGDGELNSKQVGITKALHAKFEAAYPHLNSEVSRTAVVSTEQARAISDQLIDRLYTIDTANNLKASEQNVDFGNARTGFVYGDREVHVLVDLVTGDVINFNKAN
jgi:hypothetical protein